MRFGGDQGNRPFGQADPGAPGRMNPSAGMRPTGMSAGGFPAGGIPNGRTPMPGGIGNGPGGAGMGFPTAGYAPGSGGMAPGAGMPPGMPTGMPPAGGPGPGGTIRNNLGSGLKSRGVFQKDGKINNSRGGLFGGEGGKMGSGPFSFLGSGGGPGVAQSRQLILEATQAGIAANGIATISPDNVFTCIANLPPANTLIGQSYGTYAAYLVDEKGQTGFLAGILRPVGNGAFQTQFRSQVPLAHYSRVMITVENPQQLGHVPQGPVVLQVKQPMGPSRFLAPVKKTGGSIWKKISGLIQRKSPTPVLPEGGGVPEDLQSPVNMEPPMTNPVGNPMGNPMSNSMSNPPIDPMN